MAVIEVNDDNFEDVVLNADKPVVLDFWAPWCGPCKMLAPVLDQTAGERDDIIIAKMNIDENPMTPTKYGVRSIPTVIVMKNGEAAATKMGAMPKGQFDQWLGDNI
ncbi:thioredoxin [Temperatibacter marinus]|uniref:Thioredoxin n=1 Tax=Temperatibacter marinus TaxID=1456591 RepID=A0AA52HBN5_9PROT|nr:thioredoxin [Temperatibacter marinus]WND03935.1 thioredoxin [Temperatibacter marinus]